MASAGDNELSMVVPYIIYMGTSSNIMGVMV